jgi:hypothetical protein
MRLADFTWMTNPRCAHDPTENAGRQIVLDFGKYHLSVIDDGHGCELGLLEIGLFEAEDGVALNMTSLPGITATNGSVKGHLTERDLDCIMLKLFAVTGIAPTQI